MDILKSFECQVHSRIMVLFSTNSASFYFLKMYNLSCNNSYLELEGIGTCPEIISWNLCIDVSPKCLIKYEILKSLVFVQQHFGVYDLILLRNPGGGGRDSFLHLSETEHNLILTGIL